MNRFVLAVLVVAVAVPALAADPPKVKPEEAKKAAKKAAEEMWTAMVKGDASVFAGRMYEPALKAAGGLKAIEK